MVGRMKIKFNELQAVCYYNWSNIEEYKDKPCIFYGPTENGKCEEENCPLKEKEE